MTDLAEFLLARIADDEKFGWDFEQDPETRLPRFWMERMQAECEAKRRIVEMHTLDYDECEQCSFHEAYEGFNDVSEPWPCLTLRLLALPYANHPDYRPEWRP